MSSILTGLVDGEYYEEAISFYDWCSSHADSVNLRTTVTITALIQSCQQTNQLERAISLFEEALQNQVILTQSVYADMIRMYDTSTLWRERYKDMIHDPQYNDRTK